MDFLSTHNVPCFNYTAGDGYINDDNEWVQADPEIESTLTCNIQPVRQGKDVQRLPDGIRADNAIVVRCTTQLHTTDHFDDQRATEIIYKNKRFVCDSEEDYSAYGLMTDHYKYIFIRKDLLND